MRTKNKYMSFPVRKKWCEIFQQRGHLREDRDRGGGEKNDNEVYQREN